MPVGEAFDIYSEKAHHIEAVSDAEIADAIRLYYTATHNLAEGAGAVALALALREKDRLEGRKVGVVLSGGNIDMGWFRTLLAGGVPGV